MPFDLAQNCWFLTGPTAAGKSAVGVELARRIGAEIVSLDSMALYRGMDIGTAKPTADERRSVPHHLIDVSSRTKSTVWPSTSRPPAGAPPKSPAAAGRCCSSAARRCI